MIVVVAKATGGRGQRVARVEEHRKRKEKRDKERPFSHIFYSI